MYSFNPILKSHHFRLLRQTIAIALLASTITTSAAATAFAQYNPPADLGLPNRREPGGTRGTCPGTFTNQTAVDGLTLTPLMPTTKAVSSDSLYPPYFGQTLSPYPTFYWYVPAITAKAAEFVLMDENDNELYTAKFRLTQTSEGGLISLSLPQDAGFPPLEVNQNYHWYFSLICDEFDRGTDIFTDGWVRRVESDTLPTLEALPTMPQAELANDYAQAGLWFEALEILAENQRLNGTPSDEWIALLDAVGLGNFASATFLQ